MAGEEYREPQAMRDEHRDDMQRELDNDASLHVNLAEQKSNEAQAFRASSEQARHAIQRRAENSKAGVERFEGELEDAKATTEEHLVEHRQVVNNNLDTYVAEAKADAIEADQAKDLPEQPKTDQ